VAKRAIGYLGECEADHLYVVAIRIYRYSRCVPRGTILTVRITLIPSRFSLRRPIGLTAPWRAATCVTRGVLLRFASTDSSE
jgi:hypothetical protein